MTPFQLLTLLDLGRAPMAEAPAQNGQAFGDLLAIAEMARR